MSRRPKPVHTVESDDDYDEIKTVELNPVDEINAVAARKFPKRLFATINVGKTPVRFQLDSGASCNVISAKTLENCSGEVELKKTTKRLSMYNRTTVQPLELCQLELCNTKNGNVYQVEFTALRQDCTPLLGSETTQEMDLIQVRFENILSLDLSSEDKPLTKESLIAKFPDVFNGTGKLHGSYHLEIEADAIPVVHPPRKVPIAIRPQLKEELERLHKLGILAWL